MHIENIWLLSKNYDELIILWWIRYVVFTFFRALFQKINFLIFFIKIFLPKNVFNIQIFKFFFNIFEIFYIQYDMCKQK